jgi:two-component system LytT family sensor kinase
MAMTSAKSIVRAYCFSIAIWSALALLMGWQNRGFDQPHSSLREMVLPAESIAFPFALLTPPIFYIAGRYMGDARDRFRYVLGYCLGAGPFMLLDAWIRWAVLLPWEGALQKYVSPTAHNPLDLVRQGFADQITMYITIVAAAHAYQYFDKVRKQEVEKSEFQRALAASELEALRMQIHPHFLFNTLHGISTLVDTNQPGAKAMVLKLSSLLRSTLEHSSSDLIPLREELKIVQDYLDLETMRLGARLKVDWLVGAGTEQTLVPQLILLPLVENAVRHGVACMRDGGWIEIKCERRASNLELCIRNSTGSQRTPGTGVGLKNTDARLRCLYSDEATFTFVESPDHSATATIILPALGSGLGNATQSLVDDRVKKAEGTHARASRG